MFSQQLCEEINLIVNPSFTKNESNYLNESILNNDYVLIEGLTDQIKQRLYQLFNVKSKLSAIFFRNL